MEGDDADASRVEEHPSSAGSALPSAPPPSRDDAAAAALPRRPPHVEATWQWQLVRELDRRGIHVPILSILTLRRADEQRPQRQDDDDAYRNGGFGAVPASSEAIASLPETTATGVMMEDESAVCFERYEEGDKVRTMPCSHGFHEACILKWLGISRLCPLCRFALQAEAGTD